MNESETRAEYIDPKLKTSGWGENEWKEKFSQVPFEDVGGTKGTRRI